MTDVNSFLSPIDNGSVVQRIIDKITDAIISGELKPGDRLPTEMEMSASFKVGRNSVREAVRTLAAYGVVEVRRPEGTFVCSGFSQKMINPMLYSIIMQKEDSYKDITQLRQIIETGVMSIICQQGLTPRETEILEEQYELLCEKINAADYDVADIADCDMLLHKTIANLTRNPLVITIHDIVAELTRESRYRTIKHIFEENDRQYLIDTHREQLDSLEGKNPNKLEDVVDHSYIYWKNSYNW